MKAINFSNCSLHNEFKASMFIPEPSIEIGSLIRILSNPVLFNKVGSFYSRLNYKGLFG